MITIPSCCSYDLNIAISSLLQACHSCNIFQIFALGSLQLKLMKRSLFFLLMLSLPSGWLMAQHGSDQVYRFLTLASSPRVAAFGGSFLPLDDDDLMLAMHNPALINAEMHHHIGFTFLDYYAGIKAGNVAWSRTFEKYGSFLGSVRFMHYGTFERTDAGGLEQGTFSASDISLSLGWGRMLHPGLRLGADVNLILSSYDVWSSFAVAANISGHYTSESKLFNASVLIRNAGRQLEPFHQTREPLPFDLAAGASAKLKHAPLRFYLLLNALHEWDLTYNDPLNPRSTTDPITGELREPGKVSNLLDLTMRHVIGGVELMPGEVIRLRFGYDYRTRQEAGVRSRMGMVGFSWGLGLKLGKYQFDFSRTRDHIHGAPNYFSIRTDLNRFVK